MTTDCKDHGIFTNFLSQKIRVSFIEEEVGKLLLQMLIYTQKNFDMFVSKNLSLEFQDFVDFFQSFFKNL